MSDNFKSDIFNLAKANNDAYKAGYEVGYREGYSAALLKAAELVKQAFPPRVTTDKVPQ